MVKKINEKAIKLFKIVNIYLHIKFLQNPNDMAGDKSRDVHPCFHNGPLWICRREKNHISY